MQFLQTGDIASLRISPCISALVGLLFLVTLELYYNLQMGVNSCDTAAPSESYAIRHAEWNGIYQVIQICLCALLQVQ